MKFGKAKDLVASLNELIEQHGEDVLVALYVDQETMMSLNDSVIGSVKIDSVELTKPPRVDLTFGTE